jgi:pyrroloquinoline quinone (PQQ) biosynthesis protein C/mannose-6-phosphate isomerase-like protein (cupin superfamily)
MASWMTESRASIIDPSAAAALGGSIRRADEPVPPTDRGTPLDSERRRAVRSIAPPVDTSLAKLHTAQASHPFWRNDLFRACAEGALTKADFAVVFSQYYLYSKNFTRYLAAMMANCEDDLLRAELAENIWEEGGQKDPESRHAEIFRGFLESALGVDPDHIELLDASRLFVREYLDFCMHAHPAASAAFLALGTEGIVPRMYAILLDGLLKAGIEEKDTVFFRLHMECDDAHAATLTRIMTSYARLSDWHAVCHRAMEHALDLRLRFFDELYRAVVAARLRRMMANIQGGASLAPADPDPRALVFRPGGRGEPLYENADPAGTMDFSVERVPLATEVFDTRILRVKKGKHNEAHKHPHESVFHVISGRGRVHVNRASVDIGPGDIVFVPRWATHFSEAGPGEDLVILALTDFGLTERAYVGNPTTTTRQKGAEAPRSTSPIPAR